MIKDKEIYTLLDDNKTNFAPAEMEKIFKEEKDSILKIIYGE